MAELSTELDAVRGRVKEHFQAEQESGCLETLREQQPRLGHAVEVLLAEHCRLIESLNQLIEATHSATSLEVGARVNVGKWIERLRQHEIQEKDLMQEAYNRDLGAAD